ncbi:hypothetical protein BC829DRAFT_419208 [Chytridium lagenaria]|nr:hypothetical protein BC829DRAFT_419208 [Chytridium lagenaria]
MPSGPPWRQPEYDAMLAKHIFEESPTSKLTAAKLRKSDDFFAQWDTKPKIPRQSRHKRSGGIFALSGLARTPPPNYTSIKAKGKRPIPSEAEEGDESEEDIGLSSDPVMDKYLLTQTRKAPIETNLRLHEIIRYQSQGRNYVQVIIRFVAGFTFDMQVLDGGRTFQYELINKKTSIAHLDTPNSPIFEEFGQQFEKPISSAIHRFFLPDANVDKFTYSFALPEPIDTTPVLERKIYSDNEMSLARADGSAVVRYPIAVGLSYLIAGQTIKASKRARSSMA